MARDGHLLTIRLAGLLSAFVFLLGGSYWASARAVEEMRHDGIELNLAGRQRLLTARYASGLRQDLDSPGSFPSGELSDVAELIDETQVALLRGGPVTLGTEGHGARTSLPAQRDASLRGQLTLAQTAWEELRAASDQPSELDAAMIGRLETETLVEMDRVVAALQAESEARLAGLGSLSLATAALGVALFFITLAYARTSIVLPLGRSTTALVQSNAWLEKEVAERERAEVALQEHRDRLEALIDERTNELRHSLDDLEEAGVEREKLHAGLRRAQTLEAIGRLAGGMAHDFNNYLTAIIGGIDNVEREMQKVLPADHPLFDDVDRIAKISIRAGQLTRKLLAIGRKDSSVQPTPVDLNNTIVATHDMLKHTVREDIDFELSLGERVPVIRVDRAQLEQAVSNLVINACDAMPNGGRLRIETFAQETVKGGESGRAVLRVSDTGSGIAPEILDTLFEPFVTTKEKGSGLGLAIVHATVAQARGDVRVQSELGEGTTFELSFPASVEIPTPAPTRSDHLRSSAGTASILVCEDEAAVRRIIRRLLRREGHEVLEASDGEEGLRRARAHEGRLDLLLTDVIMPRMKGPELVRKLRDERPGLPVIYMSGHTADESLQDSGVGHVELLEKPFRPDQLLERVNAVLGATREGASA